MFNFLLPFFLFFPDFLIKLFFNLPKSNDLTIDPKQWILCKISPAEILGGPGKNAKDVRKSIESFSGGTKLPDTEKVDITDHNLINENKTIKVREYFLKDGMKSERAIMYIHGGGWSVCSIDTHDQLCRFICTSLKMKIFSVDYRLAPENKYPLPLNDCSYAWNWLCTNAKKLNISAQYLSIAGDSAGGHLATTLCHKLINEKYQNLPHSQLLICPVIEPLSNNLSYEKFKEGYYLTKKAMDWFSENYIPKDHNRKDYYLWPLKAFEWEKMPATLIVSSGFDVLRDEAQDYFHKLKKEGVRVIHKFYENSIHDFPMFSYLPKPRKYTLELLNIFKSL